MGPAQDSAFIGKDGGGFPTPVDPERGALRRLARLKVRALIVSSVDVTAVQYAQLVQRAWRMKASCAKSCQRRNRANGHFFTSSMKVALYGSKLVQRKKETTGFLKGSGSGVCVEPQAARTTPV